MAKLECRLKADFDELLKEIESGILGKSISATLEDKSDYYNNEVRCAVRVFERYSMIGSNRVSLNITLIGHGHDLFLSAITSGGSQAVFFKINTFGEHAFLDYVRDIVYRYSEKKGM